MTKKRRSGVDRRSGQAVSSWNGVERRRGTDRRTLMRDPDLTIGRLRLITLFSDLDMTGYAKLLAICTKIELKQGETVCTAGDPASRLAFLISGSLRVRFPDGNELARVSPHEAIGTLALFTGAPHTATVTADGDCTMLTITREELMRLFATDRRLWVTVLTNLVVHLGGRLAEMTNALGDLNATGSITLL